MNHSNTPSVVLNRVCGDSVRRTASEGQPMSTRILIADEHEMIRAGIRAMLERMEGAQVIGEAADGPEAVTLCAQLAPDLVMIDVSIPLLNGIDATVQMVRDRPELKVIVCSARHEQ